RMLFRSGKETYKSLSSEESEYIYFSDLQENNLIIESPLWYHKRNLMQTSTGYGSKLVTEHKLKFRNRLYRIYIMQYSNSGTAYILVNKERIIIN
ncbi:MAG: hypothetical protein KKH44_07845, partial [Bacteroidetes bacterium]|nr:hypothetical protein [Bacteroidota bacterium]